ncbi:MAG: TonB family protein [Alphaproteobacteria bacterium]|nr:TonB family protein [Alphaproteobacteria bacterium]MCB9793275.1 TonB family protein [Alphaproteobacteria bacterium]
MRTPLALLLLSTPALAQEAPPGDAPVDEEELPPLVKMPELVGFVQAPYPEAAEAEGAEGSVLLLLEIDEAGVVTYVEVLVPAGHGFDEAATEAAKQFVFSPAEDTEGPVPVAIEFEYGFVLDAGSVEGAEPEEAPPEEAPAELPVNLSGLLLEKATRRTLPEMFVTVMGTELTTTSDAEGRFELRGVPSGAWTVQVSRPGWETRELEVEVVEGELTEATIWVRNESYSEYSAVGVYSPAKDEVTRRTITMNEVRRVPGTFGDPVRVVQNLPGAARSPFGSGLLIIRGANPEDSGVYVDGIRIPYIYHIGGYVSVINPELIDAVDYLPGNYGVQYGRSMGGVIDVKTKSEAPEQGRVVWSTDLLDSGGLYEGRVGKDGEHHVGVAVRRSYVDYVLPLVPNFRNSGFTARPRWQDYQLRYSYDGLERTRLSAFVFGFDDRLLLGTPDDVAQGTDQDAQDDLSIRNWSHRVILKLEHDITEDLTLRVIPSYGLDYAYLGAGQTFGFEQTQSIWELRAELPWTPSERFELIPGLDFIVGSASFEFQSPINPNALTEYDPLAEREDYFLDGKGTGLGPDVYLKANIRPFKDTDRLLLTPGLRLSTVVIVDELQTLGFDPRVAFRARLLEQGYLKGATGIFTQPPQTFESYHPNPDVRTELDNERAWSTTLGYEHQLTDAISFEVEGFYKRLDDQIVPNPNLTNLRTDQFNVNDGIGRVRGVEVMVRHAPVDRLFGWVSYTLSRSERCDAVDSAACDRSLGFNDADSDWYLFDFDQTHIFTTVAGYTLPYEIEVSGRFQYVTGNPYTPQDQGVYDIDQDFYQGFASGDRNAQRLPDYKALDLRIDKAFTFNKWRLETYLDLLNVYRGVNPEFINYNYDYTESAYIRGLPFIPSPGVEIEVFL